MQFYFQAQKAGTSGNFALVSMYSPPDEDLYRRSSKTLWVCSYYGDVTFTVVDVKSITQVVAMVPFDEGRFFAVEKLGLDIAFLSGAVDPDEGVNGASSG